MTAPLIGVSTNQNLDKLPAIHTLSERYIRSIVRAGGIPVMLPSTLPDEQLDGLFARLDGILFTGGGDIDTELYHGIPHPRVYEVDPDRDRVEINLVRRSVEQGKPFMGICRGIQVINVALGGSLFSDIGAFLPGALRHDWYPDIPRDYLAHSVKVQSGSKLAHILGWTEGGVNSLHHQGIERTADVLTPVAWAPDGLVEAVELAGHPFGIGLQWHPECLPDLPEMCALFDHFIQAAQR